MAWARATAASLSRLFFGSEASSSSTPQNRVIVCAASFACCSAGDRGVDDGVGVVVVMVAEVVVERLGLGSFVAQADVAVIAARASVAAIRLLVFVICGTPRDLSLPKAVRGVSAVNMSKLDAFTLVHSNRLDWGCPHGRAPRRGSVGRRPPSPL